MYASDYGGYVCLVKWEGYERCIRWREGVCCWTETTLNKNKNDAAEKGGEATGGRTFG